MSEELTIRAIPIEQVVSVQPFTVRRRIAFRDCDPAGIVYTPRFLDPISTSAVDLFLAELVGLYGERDQQVDGLDMPAKAVSLVFHNRVSYGDLIDMDVSCDRIGNTTFDVLVSARGAAGEALFECRITLICVEHEPYRSVPVPSYVREKLAPYVKSKTAQ